AQSIKIESSSGLSKDEVEKMRTEAESHAEEDKKKRELIDLRNQADHLVYLTEKTLKEHGSKVSDKEKSQIETAAADLKKAMEGSDPEAIKQGMEKLSQASYKLSETIYKEAAEAQKAGAEGGGCGPGGPCSEPNAKKKDSGKGPDGEDVIDAEFEVKE
ncbi:MAG: Hsp70 family protein, partial [Planctomycetes bacterium]|nr:Hsp70 family protein [Planctomycetota bacterium]